MSELEIGGRTLGKIHADANKRKFFSHFTGFLDGIAASGAIETGEVEPLLIECREFVRRIADEDAFEILEDFEVQLLEHETIEMMVSMRETEIDQACNKSKLNRFLGFCRGLVCDGIVTVEEAHGVVSFLDSNPELLEVVGVRQIYVCCIDAVEDGFISPDETRDICDAIGYIVGDSYADTGLSHVFGVGNFDEYRFNDFPTEIEGTVICLTGTFRVSPRRILEDEIAALGATIVKTVSRKTDFIVVGGEASRDWIEMNRGTKIRKAQALRVKQNSPNFVSEGQVLRCLKA